MTECSVNTLDLKGLFEHLKEKTGQRRRPYSGTIEVTQHCNLKCIHCYVAPCQQEGKILSYSEICHILDEVAEEGCFWLLLTGGEPFTRDDFLDIHTYAKKKGIFTTVFTNGTLITPEIARYFHEMPPQLMEISIYGGTSATHDSITGIPGSFNRTIKGIELLLEQGVNLKLKTMVMTPNKHEIGDMRKLARDFGVEFRFDPILNPGLDGSSHPCNLRITPEEVVALDLEDPKRREGWIKAYQAHSFMSPLKNTLFLCGAGMNQFHIDAFGGLQACTIARHHSYDLRKGSFHDGWHNFLSSISLRELSQPSTCRQCLYRVACFVCIGWTQLEYGHSLEQPIKYLCQIAHLRAKALGLETKSTDDYVNDINKIALNRPLCVDIPPLNEAKLRLAEKGGALNDKNLC